MSVEAIPILTPLLNYREEQMNIVMKASPWTSRDLVNVFHGEEVHYSEATDIASLMVEIGAYASTTKARQAGRKGAIPEGFTIFKASKKLTIWIWNPTE